MSGRAAYRRIVVKVGSALLVDDGALRQEWLRQLCADVTELKAQGRDVLIVSSGAIALGCRSLVLNRKRLTLPQKQACAAAGQAALTRAYDDALAAFGHKSAQALLTFGDTEDRRRWLNARATLDTLLSFGVVPVVNENDTVATSEIRYGDNDRLAARTAQMIGADLLVLLSDIDGLYTADPREDRTARHIENVTEMTDDILAMGGDANIEGGVGTGGMATKLIAARICMNAGCDVIIGNGEVKGALGHLMNGAKHTLFKSQSDPKGARAQWIMGSLSPAGAVVIDDGAEAALRDGRSLLAAGIDTLSGQFGKGDTILIRAVSGKEIARGLSSYDAPDLKAICGLRSDAINHPNGPVVVHRDNLVMS